MGSIGTRFGYRQIDSTREGWRERECVRKGRTVKMRMRCDGSGVLCVCRGDLEEREVQQTRGTQIAKQAEARKDREILTRRA